MSETPLYSKLHAQQIRVLQITPGRWHDDVKCDLFPAFLHETLVFDALSYAWGSSKRVRSIIVNGRPHDVTASVYQALRRLRETYGSIVVWIDALCINQSDDQERTHQVGLMRDIYTEARQVIIYLGEVQRSKSKMSSKSTAFRINADDDILTSFASRCSLPDVPGSSRMDDAFEIFCLIRSIAEAKDLKDTAPFDAYRTRVVDSKYHRHLFEALRQLMRCRWWDRMWTLQEAVVPRDVTIIYGSCVTTWGMFTRAARAYSDHRNSETISLLPFEYAKVLDFCSETVLGIETMRKRWTNDEHTTLLPLLRQFSGRKATDARDRVYALLGLVRGAQPVQPDYSIDVAAVYKRTALGIISSTGSLSVLNGDIGRKLRQGHPSWVPDWTAEYHNLDRHRAETVHHYATTLKSSIYVESTTFQEWKGIESLLKHMWTEKHGMDKQLPQIWKIDDYTTALGTSGWIDYLPSRIENLHNHVAHFKAIERYLMSQCGPICLREYGDGTISLPGLELREIVTVGAVNMSETDLIPTIQSWGILAVEQLGHAIEWDAFMRTLCADIIYPSDRSVSGCRRVCSGDLKAIAYWLIYQSSSPFGQREVAKNHKLSPIRHGIEKDFPKDETFEELYATLDVKYSVLLATSRRAFFTTDARDIGLGPAQISPEDRVYALLGGKTPFVLRSSGADSIRYELEVPSSESLEYFRFELMGDCFLHGAMDGEAMKFWQEASSGTMKTSISYEQRAQLSRRIQIYLQEYQIAQSQLQGALGILDRGNAIHNITEFSRKFRWERRRAIDLYEELPLPHRIDITGQEDWMIQKSDFAEFQSWRDGDDVVTMAVLSEEDNIPKRRLQGSESLLGQDTSREAAGMKILGRLRRKFAARLKRVELLISEASKEADAERAALDGLMERFASRPPYVLLV